MISVVVPTLNEEENIGNLLESLINQTVKPDEIIVVDSSSDDRTVEIARLYTEKVIVVPRDVTIGEARHIGTMAAKGDIIISTDADVVAPQNWIERIKQHFDSGYDVVNGGVTDLYNRPLMVFAAKLASTFIKGMGNNTAFRKSLYLKTDGYPFINYGEDVILFNKLLSLGARIVYDPNIIVLMNLGERWSLFESLLLIASIGGCTYFVTKII